MTGKEKSLSLSYGNSSSPYRIARLQVKNSHRFLALLSKVKFLLLKKVVS